MQTKSIWTHLGLALVALATLALGLSLGPDDDPAVAQNGATPTPLPDRAVEVPDYAVSAEWSAGGAIRVMDSAPDGDSVLLLDDGTILRAGPDGTPRGGWPVRPAGNNIIAILIAFQGDVVVLSDDSRAGGPGLRLERYSPDGDLLGERDLSWYRPEIDDEVIVRAVTDGPDGSLALVLGDDSLLLLDDLDADPVAFEGLAACLQEDLIGLAIAPDGGVVVAGATQVCTAARGGSFKPGQWTLPGTMGLFEGCYKYEVCSKGGLGFMVEISGVNAGYVMLQRTADDGTESLVLAAVDLTSGEVLGERVIELEDGMTLALGDDALPDVRLGGGIYNNGSLELVLGKGPLPLLVATRTRGGAPGVLVIGSDAAPYFIGLGVAGDYPSGCGCAVPTAWASGPVTVRVLPTDGARPAVVIADSASGIVRRYE